MTFYEIKLKVVNDRNPPQAIKYVKSAIEEIFKNNKYLNMGNVSLLNIEEKKKR